MVTKFTNEIRKISAIIFSTIMKPEVQICFKCLKNQPDLWKPIINVYNVFKKIILLLVPDIKTTHQGKFAQLQYTLS